MEKEVGYRESEVRSRAEKASVGRPERQREVALQMPEAGWAGRGALSTEVLRLEPPGQG